MTRYTPEQRTDLLYAAGAISAAPPDARQVVLEQIRDAHNAAIERAAILAMSLANNSSFDRTRMLKAIRSLKVRAPRKAAKAQRRRNR